MTCQECYSDHARITPLKGAKDCLSNHLQYICSTCGRVICIDQKGEKRARCLMPFDSLEKAMLYLKTAEIILEDICGIYELIYKRGEKRYRIFKSITDLHEFLKRTPAVRCERLIPVYISEQYHPIQPVQVRPLTQTEVKKYLDDRKGMGIIDK
jgi:hypothetical protein